MIINLILYADGHNYQINASKIFAASADMFDKQTIYGKNDLDALFIENYKHILSQTRGAGYWLWKPYVILKALNEANEGDIIFYIDCGDLIYNNIRQFIIDKINENDGFFLVRSIHSHLNYTKKDVFQVMECDREEYWNLKQMEAGYCGFRKQKETIDFVEEWLYWCKKDLLITDYCSQANYDGFIDNRHDQSIFTNLVQKKQLKTIDIDEVFKYIKPNYLGA